MSDNQFYSELQLVAPGDVEIHLVNMGPDAPDQFGLYVMVDGVGSLIALFNDAANLETVIALIMALQGSAPVAASQRVQDLLASIVPDNEGDIVT